MLFTQWLNELTDRVLRKRSRKFARKVRKVSRNAPTSSEVLESRVVPTITVDLSALGVLTVTGDAGANRVTISVTGTDSYTIDGGAEGVDIGTNASATATVTDNGNSLVIGGTAGDINEIIVTLGDGGDKLTVASIDDAITDADGGDDSGDTIQGPNVAMTAWTIDEAGAGNSVGVGTQVVSFSGFRIAQGGTEADTFTISSASTLQLKGGLGDNSFNLGAALTGSISGEDGVDILTGNKSIT